MRGHKMAIYPSNDGNDGKDGKSGRDGSFGRENFSQAVNPNTATRNSTGVVGRINIIEIPPSLTELLQRRRRYDNPLAPMQYIPSKTDCFPP